MKSIAFVMSVFLALASCTKESASPTQAQINAAKMKSTIGNGSVTSILIEDGTANIFSSNISNNNYKITTDGFLQVGNNSFSLERLILFQYGTGSLWLKY